MDASPRAVLALVATCGLVAIGCGDAGPLPTGRGRDDPAPRGANVDPFAPDALLSIDVTMPVDAWEALRNESRSLSSVVGPGCQDGPHASPFGDHTGDVRIDGQAFSDVVVRKKGFLGSLSDERPSLRLDLDAHRAGAAFAGLDHLVLNNAQQDPAVVRTCLAYGVLRDAGVPAPRCGFAHVVVNGVDLGVYVHVERPRAAFLRRWFDDDDGVLIEGTLSDFAPSWRRTFERERGDQRDADRLVQAITAALDADDDRLLDALEPVVDLDAFFRFWAAEVVVAHWDGYAGNRNNFLVHAGRDGRARFIAWGMDATFQPLRNTSNPAVLAHGMLARRLYAHPDGRARYRAAVDDVLDAAWDEDVLFDRLVQASALVSPHVHDAARFDAAVDETLAFVASRRDELAAGLAAAPAWTEPYPDTVCFPPAGVLSFSFATTFGSWPAADTFSTGDGTFAAVVEGEALAAVEADGAPAVGAAAGFDDDGRNEGRVVVIVPAVVGKDRVLVPVLSLRTARATPGVFAVDDAAVQVLLLGIDDAGAPYVIARAYEGTVALEQASTAAPGAPFRGRVDGLIFASGF
jgi:hypothetical protein